MMHASQFVVSKGIFPEGWLRCRRDGVTATQVAKAATPAGFEQAVRDYQSDFIDQDNPFMKFGRDMEPVIARILHQRFDILPNDWLIKHADIDHHRATPDGLSLDHTIISEIKTSGKDFETGIPAQYKRQVQWQLHVTGAQRCLFAWMQRLEVEPGVFAPAWFEPKTCWIDRDEAMIEALIITADELWERVNREQ